MCMKWAKSPDALVPRILGEQWCPSATRSGRVEALDPTPAPLGHCTGLSARERV